MTLRASTQVAQGDLGQPDKAFYASANYAVSKYSFDLAYSTEKNRSQTDINTNVQGRNRNTVLAGVNGNITDALKFTATYLRTATWAQQGAPEVDRWFTGGSLMYTAGKNIFRVGTTYTRGQGDGTDAQMFIVGYEYVLPSMKGVPANVSSSLYVEASHVRNGANVGYSLADGNVDNGKNPSTIAVGVITNF